MLELGAPYMSGVRSAGGSPGTAAPGRARDRHGKREKGERAGALTSGAAWRVGLSCREREDGRENERPMGGTSSG
jgi:hypothetical protein